ncbi:restriction endonuclease subunit S [Nitrosomonas communis]|uniref:restriction endonuclease subunit S n=1 Tax=Nitrosomonas communis TaxID=44574 RepID=UPI0026EBFE93|nr:restriction endonuclease subunit S [Nitrosomonas communis]MCO6427912.1 restriction endonuclease subunit S [Nitrosomonas communis]
MSWMPQRLDQLGYLSRGRSRHRPRDAAHLYGGPYPFIQTSDVKHAGLYITEYKQTYNDAGLQQSKLWPAGTLCITIAANIADTAILGIDACFPDSVIGFIADEKKADARFVKYLFDATIKRRVKQFTQGAAQDNLSQEKLLSIEFPIPNVSEQKRIASILSAYDDLIENNRRRIQLLEQAARLLYKEWFVHLRFPGHEHTKIIDGVPEGWERKTAFEVMDILSGGTPKTNVPEYWNGDIPFFTPKDTTDYAYVFVTEKHLTDLGIKNCNSKLYPKDTVFITARGTVGKINLAQTTMAMNQSCYALIAKPPLNQYYLYFALIDGVEHFRSRAVGAVFDAIIRDTFKLIPFVAPERNLIQTFTEHTKPILKQIDILSTETRKLIQARDLLLPRLMNGALAV